MTEFTLGEPSPNPEVPMRLANLERIPSPLGEGRHRQIATIELATPGLGSEQIWFDIEDRFDSGSVGNGDAWLACLLPWAVTLGESLEIPVEVDSLLLDGANNMMSVWDGWYPEMFPVSIDAPVRKENLETAGRTGVMFSGGLDSFHALLHHEPDGGAIERYQIDDLITVWGFDVPLSRPDAFARVSDLVSGVAAEVGKESLTLATNLRESAWQGTNWGRMGQGPALASIAMFLGHRFQRVLVPSSMRYAANRAWGTHPLADQLLSSKTLDFRNDGARFGRWGKAPLVAASPIAMDSLRVCWIGQSDRNCGSCEKCLRTLTIFEVLGHRDRCTSFPPDSWSLEALAAQRFRNDLERRYQGRLAERALEGGRPDIAKALQPALRRYDLRRSVGRLLRSIGIRR